MPSSTLASDTLIVLLMPAVLLSGIASAGSAQTRLAVPKLDTLDSGPLPQPLVARTRQ